MLQASPLLQKRIDSVDVLRGIVMVIMALDHVRDYFHITANTDYPLNMATTTPLLYFTRWITHFCAPTFVLLSGVSVFLQSLRKTKAELSSFLIKRGFWLIIIELVVISFGWSFNPNYNFVFLQVIWAIGVSMVILGILVWLPHKIILLIGLLIVFGHNLLDIPESEPGFQTNFWWDLWHNSRFTAHSYAKDHAAIIAYPLLPWIGLMACGYSLGKIFSPNYSTQQRRKILFLTSFTLIFIFIVLRFVNGYGDPYHWSTQPRGDLYTFLSFMDVHKYPPSLLFICITIGPALIVLAVLENVRNAFTSFMRVFGRVPFFYYILHIYLIHLVSAICFLARGHSFEDGTITGTIFPFYFVAPGEGYGLGIVYLVWILIVLALYPLCKWYDGYKTRHKEKKWLSYL